MNASIFFWRGCIVFIGDLPELPLHSHLNAALCAGLDGPIQVRGPGYPEWTRCRLALLPSGALHAVRAAGTRFASILIEPGSRSEEAPQPEPAATLQLDPPENFRIVGGLRALSALIQVAQIETTLDDLLAPMCGVNSRSDLDPRIDRIIKLLLTEPTESQNVGELAAMIDMSPSWLQHTFRKEVGVPIRRFRVWFRLKVVALYMQRGSSLVDAAVAAGFYDQPHFSNAFREHFGIQPGLIFREGVQIRWHVSEAEFVDRVLAAAGLR